MKSITIVKTIVEAQAGSYTDDCKREALLLALTRQEDVELIHNNCLFVVSYRKLLDFISEKD